MPKSEDFGLKSQMKRAIVSVLSNFVEGYLKRNVKEKLHFLEIAKTSLLELEAQAEICLILGFWTDEDIEEFENKRRESAYLLFRYISKKTSDTFDTPDTSGTFLIGFGLADAPEEASF